MKKDSKFQNEALTFDDVLLVPSYSQIIPSDTNVQTALTKNIGLNIPLLSASMDTVTESRLAIAMALKGGIGIIHKNMSIENQSGEIRRVKRSQSGMIKDPITMDKNSTVKDALQVMKKNQIGGIPIINSSNELIGIVTNRDLRFQKENDKDLTEVTSPTFNLLNEYYINKIKINHYDLFRLKSTEEIKNLGLFENYMDSITLIEWPQMIKDKPKNLIELYFEYGEDHITRSVQIEGLDLKS